MRLNFTQGIVRCQKDLTGNQSKFLQINSDNDGYIDLVVAPDPTIVVFSHRNKNYLIEETIGVEKAWGPFPATGQTQFLYWDINFASGAVTRGWTTVAPSISTVAPASPVNDQHWFNTSSKSMFVWKNNKWVEVIRVFAGIYDQAAVLAPKQVGTQVGLNNIDVSAGNLMLSSNGSPLRDSDGSFLTTESELVISHTSSENVRFDAVQQYCQASESIPKFYLVSYTGIKTVSLASYLRVDRQVNGLVREHLYAGETGNVITSGKVKNDAWSWDAADIGKPLFCGPSGQITRNVPPTGVCQQVGTIVDTDEIYLWILSPIIL